MELDELIRESSPEIGAAPAITELRAGARRRSARRVRAIGAAVVVAVIAVLVPLLIPGDETNSTVAVRPHPVGRTLSSWSKIAAIPPDTDVSTTTQIELVASDGNLFLISHEERPDDTNANWIRVDAVDRATGELTDLAYDALRPAGWAFNSAVGWQGGLVVISRTVGGWSIDRWADGAWTTMSRPDPLQDVVVAPALSATGPELVVAAGSVGVVYEEFQGVVGQRAWSTADGETWSQLPDVPDDNGYGTYSGSDGSLVRQRFTPLAGRRSLTTVLGAGASTWTDVPPPPFASHGSLQSVEFEGVLVSCGTDELRFDCARWSAGDDAQRESDPPPFRQGGWEEGRAQEMQLLAVPDRGVLMVASGTLALYRPDEDRWHRVPGPSGASGVSKVIVVDGDVYAVAYEAPVDADAHETSGIYRLDLGADDPEVDPAVAVGEDYRVRLPSDRWTAGMGADDSGLSVGTGDRVPDGQGGECPALQVDFVEGTAPDAPSEYSSLRLPDSTPPCTPTVVTTLGGGRRLTMRVYRSGPTTPDDAAELMEVIGSFRAAVR